MKIQKYKVDLFTKKVLIDLFDNLFSIYLLKVVLLSFFWFINIAFKSFLNLQSVVILSKLKDVILLLALP